MSAAELAEVALLREASVDSGFVRDKIFCFTSSVVYAAPVLRIPDEEPDPELSEDVLESELPDLVVNLCESESFLGVVTGVTLFVAAVL